MPYYNSLFFRILVPSYFRRKIRARALRDAIFDYYSSQAGQPDEEIQTALEYLKHNPITFIPYSFQNQYVAERIEVLDDPEKGLKYVIMDGKRLYFKRKWNREKIRAGFNELIKEQDPKSPHRYLDDRFTVEEGEVVFDVGVAEGNFALSVVGKASRLVLFETDEEWIEALNATFEPWKDKVQIVNKFVGDQTDANNTALDDFISPEEKISFLKIDVDGAESRLLKGCARLLSEQKPMKIALCTYHKQHDEKEFRELLTRHGFKISHSDGYMLCYFDRKLEPPYFRRGLLRAVK